MKKRNRGQIASQLFVYILGIIVVGLLLLVGFRAVSTLTQSQCKVKETQFVTQLASDLEKDKQFGASHVHSYDLPCDVKQICFISRDLVTRVTETNDQNDPAFTDMEGSGLKALAQNIRDDVDTNIYKHMNDGSFLPVERFAVPAPLSITVDDHQGALCIGGEPLQVRFNGQGQLVEVLDERNG